MLRIGMGFDTARRGGERWCFWGFDAVQGRGRRRGLMLLLLEQFFASVLEHPEVVGLERGDEQVLEHPFKNPSGALVGGVVEDLLALMLEGVQPLEHHERDVLGQFKVDGWWHGVSFA